MSDQELKALEESSFEVEELDESELEEVAGGSVPTNGSGCNGSQCACPHSA